MELAADLVERELWRGVGTKSPEHWLSWKAGLSPQRARHVVAIAQRRRELPATVETLSRGAGRRRDRFGLHVDGPADDGAMIRQAGGRTDIDNLACLCPFHHDALHRGELSITGDPNHPDTLRFIDADGQIMPPLIRPVLPALTPPTTIPRGPTTRTSNPRPTATRPANAFRRAGSTSRLLNTKHPP